MDNRVDLPGYKSYRLRADGSRPDVFVAFLDIEPCSGSAVARRLHAGRADDLAALDARERNYDRIDVTSQVQDAPAGRVWAYRGSAAGRARLRDGLAAGRAVVSLEYLADVLAGLAKIAPGEVAALQRSPAQAGLAILDLTRVEVPRAGNPPDGLP